MSFGDIVLQVIDYIALFWPMVMLAFLILVCFKFIYDLVCELARPPPATSKRPAEVEEAREPDIFSPSRRRHYRAKFRPTWKKAKSIHADDGDGV